MTTLDFAKRIPDRIRSERLIVDADPIGKAQPVANDKRMELLYSIWYEFIEPFGTGDISCPTCLQRLLGNFREMKADLIRLEKEYRIIKAIL